MNFFMSIVNNNNSPWKINLGAKIDEPSIELTSLLSLKNKNKKKTISSLTLQWM